MKKIIIVLLGVIVVALGIYFVSNSKKNNQSASPISTYQEPATKFIDATQVPSSAVVVKITDAGFEPDSVTIKQGETVTWVNASSTDAWPASNPHPTHTDYPGFDPQNPVKPGKAWTFTFDKVGDWGYHNHLNPSMRGQVTVTQ